MRFAVLSNIHANVDAVRAILADVEANPRHIERVVAAGDLIGLGPFPNELLDLLRERDIEAVRGNYDDAVAFDRLNSGVDFPRLDEEEADRRAVRWTRQELTPENLKYLQELPRTLQLLRIPAGLSVKRDVEDQKTAEYRRNFLMRALLGGLARPHRDFTKRVMVMHGTPRAMNEYIRPDTANSILASVAREADSDVIVSGHAGIGFAKVYERLTFVGSPSVGRPVRHHATAEYGIVDVGETVEAETVGVPYDAGPFLEALARSGLPPTPVFF